MQFLWRPWVRRERCDHIACCKSPRVGKGSPREDPDSVGWAGPPPDALSLATSKRKGPLGVVAFIRLWVAASFLRRLRLAQAPTIRLWSS
jgi:hypothetical protein